MKNYNKANAAIIYSGKSQAEVSELAGFSSPQFLNRKLTGNTLYIAEMEAIADAIGAKLEITYTFEDGKVI